MVQLTTRERVDAFWSNTFDVDAADLREPGVRVRSHTPSRASWRAVYLLGFGDAACVFAPTDVVPALASVALHRADTAIQADSAFSPATWTGLLGSWVDQIVGPGLHHYLDQRDGVEKHATGRRINPGDSTALAALRAAVPPAEWTLAGFTNQPAVMFGRFEGDVMVAAANLGAGPDAATDIGVVVHPAARGQGYGTQIVAAAARQALLMHRVARYRTLSGDGAALAIARRLGFEEYGHDLTVHLVG